MKDIDLKDLEKASGGMVVADAEGEKYWIVRQDGSVVAPAPTLEQAIEFAKALNTSATVMTLSEYKAHFGRDLVW